MLAEPDLVDGSSGTCKTFPAVDGNIDIDNETLAVILPSSICGRTQNIVNLNVTVGKCF